ncbi:hypothetical protein [Devosia ureilytica]|uniref:hypothetical protein n=1 Tax=Devosia ureilytica TaxID=2952754 RepID=UPI0038CDA314
MIVLGGGLTQDGRWISSRPGIPAAGAGARRAVPPVVPQQAARPPWCRKNWLLLQAGRAQRPPRLPASPRAGP